MVLKLRYLWFILETTGEAHQLCLCLTVSLILCCPLVDSTHISPRVHFVSQICIFLFSYALLNSSICTTSHTYTQFACMPGWIDDLVFELKISSLHPFIQVMLLFEKAIC